MKKTISLFMLGFISVMLVLSGVLSAASNVPKQYAFASTEGEVGEDSSDQDSGSSDEDSEDDSGNSNDDDQPTAEPPEPEPSTPVDDQLQQQGQPVQDPTVEPELVACPDGINQAPTLEECPVDTTAMLAPPPDVETGCMDGTGTGTIDCIPCNLGDPECKPKQGTDTFPPIAATQQEPQATTVQQLATGRMVLAKEQVLPVFTPNTQAQMQVTDDPVEGATLAIQDLEQQGIIPSGSLEMIKTFDQQGNVLAPNVGGQIGGVGPGGGTGTAQNAAGIGILLYIADKVVDKILAGPSQESKDYSNCISGGGKPGFGPTAPAGSVPHPLGAGYCTPA